MSIIFMEGFDEYRGEKPRTSMLQALWLTPQRWWRRLLRMDRPPQTIVIGFSFKGGELHHIDAKIQAPAGVDAVVVEMAWLDGKPIEIQRDLYLASMDTKKGER
jgi:hypothetical protein